MRQLEHPRERVTFVRDPQIRFGPFRVLRRTDACVVVIDMRKHFAADPVAVFEGKDQDAIELARSEAHRFWEAEGCPSFEPA